MTAVSSRKFTSNRDKYNDFRRMMTVEDILTEEVGEYAAPSEYDKILEPDEDFYNALSADEFRVKLIEIVEKIDKKYANR
jgi:Mg2+/Co2+ transporter CorC